MTDSFTAGELNDPRRNDAGILYRCVTCAPKGIVFVHYNGSSWTDGSGTFHTGHLIEVGTQQAEAGHPDGQNEILETVSEFSKESRSDAVELLHEPDLWKRIDGELEVTIKEDPEGRQGTFACELTAFQYKPAHLMLLASTAVGKTWLAKQTSAFMPPEHVQTLGSSTQRAWFYCGEAIYKPHPLIPKKQVIDYYKVDWRNKVVIILDNVTPATIKDLKPIMSHDGPVIDIQTTERTGGNLRTRRVRTYGCPAFVNCSTWLTWGAELTSRHFYLSPKDTPKKYEAAADYLDEEFTTGEAPTSKMLPIIRDAIRHLHGQKLQVVIHPNVIAELRKRFTWKSGRDVRDYERAATIIQAVAWLHALQRERTEHGDVLADERDLAIVNGFIEPLLKTSRYGTSSEVLEYYERVLKPLAVNATDIHQRDAVKKYIQVYDRRLSRDELYEFNRILETLGKIELVQDAQDKRRRLIRLTDTQTEL